MTKQEQKDAAWKAYEAIREPAWEAYEAIEIPAWKAYKTIQEPAWKAYKTIEEPAWKAWKAEIERIDNDQSDESFWDFCWENDWPMVCAGAAIILWAVVLLIVIS